MSWSLVRIALIGALTALAPAGETHVDLMPDPNKALALDAYTPAPRVVAQATTFAGLVAIAKPTIVANHDMIWAKRDTQGRYAFTFATAKWVRFGKGPPVWAVLRRGGDGSERDRNGFATDDIAEVAIRDLAPGKSHADPGDGDYARILLHAHGCDLYEIGIENDSIGSSHGADQRRLYVLRGPGDDAWQFVGEGPAESSGRAGALSSGQTVRVRARLIGDPKAPVVIAFTMDCSSTLLGEESRPACPELTIHRDALLDGPLPAKLRWLTDPYVIAGKDADTLDAIINQYIYWNIDDAAENLGKSKRKEAAAFRKFVQERNPALARGQIPWGEVVYLPSKQEIFNQ